jgi:hypothetical protein
VPVRLVALLVAVLTGGALVTARPRPVQSDLDEFMKAVLERRDENWKKLQQYVLDEREVIHLRGPGRIPVWGESREYSWYIRDGFFVRSPVKVNGVTVPEEERVKYETEYLERAKEREAREREEAAKEAAADAPAVPAGQAPVDANSLLSELRRPRFVDQAYFLKFKFEQGKYALVGRETFEDREVLRIEYYPARLFDHEQKTERDRQSRGEQNRSEDREAAFERMMNKVSLVTLWVEPTSHQIVKYTFDNVNLDFLPGAWLARVTDLTASMTMSQPFPDVWLPRDIDLYGGVMLAVGPFDIRYELDYVDYREAITSGRIKREPEGP